VTDRETRRLSFGSVAEDYDRYRPPPPPQALDWLIPPGASGAGAVPWVADSLASTAWLAQPG
jgi:hypothetical protein